MADEAIVNGVTSDDRSVEISGKEDRDDLFVDFDDNDNKVSDSNLKIAALEQEKAELFRENGVIGDRLRKLKDEIEGLEREKAEMERQIEQSEADKKALAAIAARAAQLEAEVSRLQHDLISTSTAAEDANAELSDLKRLVGELEKSDSEKGSKVEILEKERNLLLEKLDFEAQGLKESKAEAERRIQDLQKKIGTLEGRESTQSKGDEEAKGLIAENEREIHQLKKLIGEMDSAGVQKGLEIERLKKEIEELEIVKNETEALLKKSERKVKEMENKTDQLQLELEGAEKMISGLKEKAGIDGLNGIEGYVDRAIVEDGEEGLMGLRLQWPIVAASTGALAAVAVVYYLRYGRQR